MPVSLLDVNVLVSLSSEDALLHEAAWRWFDKNARAGWATCPLIETAFVRIVANPAASRVSIRPAQALELLRENLSRPSHQFWPDDLSAAEALGSLEEHLIGHQQITDAYLLGLAAKHKGRLVTFDKAIAALAEAAGLRHLVTTLAP